MSRQEKIEYIMQRFSDRGRKYPQRVLETKSDKVIDAMYTVESDAEDREVEEDAAMIF